MQLAKSQEPSRFGHQLVDEISLPEQTLNQLFGALLLTALGVFIGANLLFPDPLVLHYSAQIGLTCVALLLIFYALSRQIGLIWGLALTYGLMWMQVYTRLPWLGPMIYGFAGLAFLYTVRYLRVERLDWWLLLLMAVIAIATILGVSGAYTSFDMLQRLHAGDVHQDTLFHASIAAMIKNYGVVSTGLHGLVEMPYHILSHVLMASVSLLSGQGVIEVYGVANWVMFAPILIFSITAFCAMLDRTRQLPLPLVWGLTAVLLVAMPFLFGSWAVWDSFFASESYLVSLGLFTLGLAVLFKRRLSLPDILLVLFLAALISNAKASVGLVYSGLWFSRLLFVRGDSTWRELAALMMAVLAVAWAVIDLVQGSSGSMPFDPLHFVRTYSFLGSHLGVIGNSIKAGMGIPILTMLLAIVAVSSFFVLHFSLSWVVVGLIGYSSGVRGVLKSPLSIYSLAAIFAGVLIIFTFAIGGGSAYYFSNVALFVSLPGVIAMLAGWMERRHVDHRMVLILSLFLVFLLGVKGLHQISALHPRNPTHQNNVLINELVHLRNTSPLHFVLRPNADAMASNPVKRCTAKPFLFPAVSERAWVDVVSDGSNGCHYVYYGYAQYGITEVRQQVNVRPGLLPGMTIKKVQ